MSIVRGDTCIFNLSVKNSAGAAFDLTGYTIKFTTIGPKAITKLSTGTSPGIVITNAAGGLATISLSAIDTDTVGRYQYDVQISDSTHVYTVIISELQIIDDITKT